MVQLRSQNLTRHRRDAWLEINLANLEFNIKALYEEFNKPLIPVLKADAYGHGADVLVQILDGFNFIHAYAVASIDEALNLRQSTKSKIIVLGISPDWAISQALENDIELTIVDLASAQSINENAKNLKRKAQVHIKLDTGMNRIGFKNNFREDLAELEKLENIEIQSIFSHFADPDNSSYSQKQQEAFTAMTQGLKYPLHPCSTQAARTITGIQCDYLRCGIELYGLENPQLKPLMSLYARVSFSKKIAQGESVSYQCKWTAEKDTWISTLPLGYADGLRRSLSNKIEAFVNNKRIKQVGLITMDQTMFASDEEINKGDLVELLGENIKIREWCQALDTISYEIISSLNLRLPKTYTRS